MAGERKTALYDWHRDRGARMVAFAGWSMPIQYPTGILAEHRACREQAALFDVSHMGTVRIPGPTADAAKALETVLGGELQAQRSGLAKYTLMLTSDGGIVDDLMAIRHDERWYLVINASRVTEDMAVLEAALPEAHRPVLLEDRSLLALQGPAAVDVLAAHLPVVRELRFRHALELEIDGAPGRVARIGYTGEDGFEIEVQNSVVHDFVAKLTADARVTPAGLGARDSLRLEAGLCLYGHEIDTQTSPVAAGLGWTINKRRRQAGDFPGAARILAELDAGLTECLVGLRLEGRLPAREGALILSDDRTVGRVTSGGFGPTVGAPIAMGYVEAAHSEIGTPLACRVRQHDVKAVVSALPFVPHHYQR